MNELTLRKSRDFGEVLSVTFSYIRIHFKTLGKGLVLFSLPLIILSGVLIGSGFGDAIVASDSVQTDPELASLGFRMLGGMLTMMLTFVFIIVIVFKHMQLVDQGEEAIEMNMLLEDFGRNFFGVIGLFIVIGLATIIGFIFLIIPGIYISTKLSLAPAIYVIEEAEFGQALVTSWNITQDYWWFTFGMSFVMSLIVNVASNIVIVPMYILMMVVVFSSGEPDTQNFGTLFSLMYGLSMITVGLLYCMPVISQAMVYFNLQERKSGDSLSAKIDTLGNY